MDRDLKLNSVRFFINKEEFNQKDFMVRLEAATKENGDDYVDVYCGLSHRARKEGRVSYYGPNKEEFRVQHRKVVNKNGKYLYADGGEIYS